jgi:hypothetical protein
VNDAGEEGGMSDSLSVSQHLSVSGEIQIERGFHHTMLFDLH